MVRKLLADGKIPFSADNTINYLSGKFTPVMTPYMSDEDAWLIMPKPYDGGFMFFWRVRPYLREGKDDQNDDILVKIRTRFSCGYSLWYETYGSSGI